MSFAVLSKHGRRRQGRWCWIRYAPFPTESDGADHNEPLIPQVGYAVGKKVGNAVVRNRIRRRLRPIVRAEATNLAPGIYLIGVRDDRAARISYEELQDDLHQLLVAVSARRN